MNDNEMSEYQMRTEKYYWETQTIEVTKKLLQHFKAVEIINYKNDLCPSVLVNEEWLIFLPNSEENDPSDEKFNDYNLKPLSEYGLDTGITFNTLDEVIKELHLRL